MSLNMNALAGVRLRSLTKELLKFKIDRLLPSHISCRSCSFILCENAAAEKPNDMTELLSCVSTDKQIPDANFFPFEIEFHPLRGLAQIEMFQFVQFMYFTPTIDCLRVIRKCTLNGMMDRVTAA